MTPVEEYRAKARDCDDQAERTRDPLLKQQWGDFAQQWRDLAMAAESRR